MMTNGGKPLVSIIVPVYKVEEYLAECVDSLLMQTYPNIEIILVDDGSPDDSGAVCDAYAASDSRVTVIHKENGGPGSARNTGVGLARGEWLTFIDGDDYVSPIFIEVLFQAAVKMHAEVALLPSGSVFREDGDCNLINEFDITENLTSFDSVTCLQMMLYQEIDSGLHGRLYRKNRIGAEPFPIDMCIGEDIVATYGAVLNVDRVALVDCRALYAYRWRSGSLIRREFEPVKAQSALKLSSWLKVYVQDRCPELAPAVSSRCFSVCRMVYAQLPVANNKDSEVVAACRAALWREIQSHSLTVVRDLHARKRERLAACISLLGESPFSSFCRVARRMGLLR